MGNRHPESWYEPGKKYGRLVIIREVSTEERKGKSRELICKCDCGNIKRVNASAVFIGNVKSCGCLQKERASEAVTKYGENLIGKRFNRLTIISAVPKDEWQKKGTSEYLCKCDCGTYKRIATTCLITGNTKSCGCLNTEKRSSHWNDISGQKFNELIAIKKMKTHYSKSGNRTTMWLFRCSCGKEVVLSANNVKSGATKSCGHIGQSMAEYKIEKWLKNRGIKHEREASFYDLTNPFTGYSLHFDFKIYREDGSFFLIEHQGEQHFKDTSKTFGVLQRTCTDQIKKQYCETNGITLYETLYNEDYITKLEDIIRNEIEQGGVAYEKEVKNA